MSLPRIYNNIGERRDSTWPGKWHRVVGPKLEAYIFEAPSGECNIHVADIGSRHIGLSGSINEGAWRCNVRGLLAAQVTALELVK